MNNPLGESLPADAAQAAARHLNQLAYRFGAASSPR